MVDKSAAILLRQGGLSYSEIAQRLGCSKAWCALHLKGIERGETEGKLSSEELRERTLGILEKAIIEIKALQ